jgi:signal recognition particle subunit SRP19
MSRHAQVEEVSDSDPEEVAPSEGFDDANFARESIISPSIMHPPPGPAMRPPPQPPQEIPKNYQCLYAVYFDKTRSRTEGRQVSSKLAVENPLARDILDACQQLGLRVGFEPEKLHPKDWANPGRVRVLLKDEEGNLLNPRVKNSMVYRSPFP